MTPRTTIKSLQRKIELLKKQIGQLQGLIEIDVLTGLYNRHGFIKRTEGFLKEVEWNIHKHKRKKKRSITYDFLVIFIDLDNFKMVNDVFGHKNGDKVLKEIAGIFEQKTKKIDIVSRWGGDELVIGLVRTNKEAGLKMAQRLCDELARHKISVNGKKIKITASLGVASALEVYKEEGHFDVYELVEKTDEAMYKAKREFGKNFVVDYHQVRLVEKNS